MKLAITAVVTSVLVAVALAACGTATVTVPPPAATPRPPTSSSPAAGSRSPFTATRQAAPVTTTPAAPAAPVATPTPAAPPANVPDVTAPWAVVSAYYGAIESGDYREAWALINYGATTGQTYQQFVDGFACTGTQTLSEVSASATQVTFDLSATDACTGQVQHFTGTDTVENGKIVAADVHQTG
jgi:hypothetical protein